MPQKYIEKILKAKVYDVFQQLAEPSPEVVEKLNGDVYQGEFMNDKANGYGVYTHKEGSRYEGHWKDDIKHGFGKE